MALHKDTSLKNFSNLDFNTLPLSTPPSIPLSLNRELNDKCKHTTKISQPCVQDDSLELPAKKKRKVNSKPLTNIIIQI